MKKHILTSNKHIPGITETSAVRLFNEKFGVDILSRVEKLAEEFDELTEAFGNVYNGDGLMDNPEALAHLNDEICDLYGALTHLAAVRGLYHRDMLDSCVDKIRGRETDPGYRR